MGKRRIWSDEEIAMLGTMSDVDLAEKLGIPKANVTSRRHKLGIAPFNAHKSITTRPWTDKEIALLGAMPDASVAHMTNRALNSVQQMRHRMRIPAYNKKTSKIDRAFLAWHSALEMSAPEFFKAIQMHYADCFESKLTHSMLAAMSHYSLSRVQKWFTAGTAQEPLAISTRHHLWLLAQSWSTK